MNKLDFDGQEYMEQMYDKNLKETKDSWFPDISKEIMIASLNHAGTCDEAHPDHDFISGVMWERRRKRKLKRTDKGEKTK